MKPRVSRRMWLLAVPFLMGSVGCSGGEVQETEPISTVAVTTTRLTTTTTTEATTTTLFAQDVQEILVGTLSDPEFEGEAELSMEIRVGDITVPASGSSRFQGGNSHIVVDIEGVQRQETISFHGVEYKRVDDGPWVSDEGADPASSKKDDDSPDPDPLALVKTIVDSEHQGTEVENGMTIYRFEPPAGTLVDLAALGYASDDPVEIEGVFFAKDDGSPHRFEFFVEDFSDPESVMSFEFVLVFVEAEGPVVISPPQDVWLCHTSDDFGYTIAYPRGWEVDEYRGDDFSADFFIGLGGDELDVFRIDLPQPEQISLNTWVTEFRSLVASDGLQPGDIRQVEVAEQPGRMLSYTGQDDTGAELLGVYVVTQVSESSVFEFILITGAEQTAGEQLIGDFLATFQSTE